jgi:hypothetical protein
MEGLEEHLIEAKALWNGFGTYPLSLHVMDFDYQDCKIDFKYSTHFFTALEIESMFDELYQIIDDCFPEETVSDD